jgi:hypothetical protein
MITVTSRDGVALSARRMTEKSQSMRKNSLFMWLSIGAGKGAVRHLCIYPSIFRGKKIKIEKIVR